MTALVSGRACVLRAQPITTIDARLYTLVRMTVRYGTPAVLGGSISPPAGGGFDREVDSNATGFQHPARIDHAGPAVAAAAKTGSER
jgi:hypothetical protein